MWSREQMNDFVLNGNRTDKAMKIVYKTPRKYMFLWSCYLSETGAQLKDLSLACVYLRT